MPGPAPQAITITPAQRRVLEQIVRRHTSPQQQARRAQIILAAAAGANNAAVGRQVGVTEDTARTWRQRWAAAGEALLAAEAEGGEGALAVIVAGVLADEARPGAPPTFTPEQLCQVVAIACEAPADAGRPISHWTPREVAAEAMQRGIVARISARTVGRLLGGGRAPAAPPPVLADPAGRRPGGLRRASGGGL